MDRAVRDRFASGTQKDLTAGNACWETAPKVFEKLNADFGPFDLDLTANPASNLCPVWFGPDSPLLGCEDAISVSWMEHGRNGYSNPPYGPFVAAMLSKARLEARAGFTSTLLLPLRITKALQANVLLADAKLLFCDRRLTFFEGGKPRTARSKQTGRLGATPALFDSIIVRYTPDQTGLSVGLWSVPEHVGDLRQYFTDEEIRGVAPQVP